MKMLADSQYIEKNSEAGIHLALFSVLKVI